MLRLGFRSWPLLTGLYDNVQTHHIRQNSSGRAISPTQNSLPEHTQNLQKTDFHALSRIRTRIPSVRAATDLRLRPRRHRDQQIITSLKMLHSFHILNFIVYPFLNFSNLKPDSYNNQSTHLHLPLIFLPINTLRTG